MAYYLNREEYRSVHLSREYFNAPVGLPQYFFTYKTLSIKTIPEAQYLEGKIGRLFNTISDKIQDDMVEVTYMTLSCNYIVIVNSNLAAFCYKIPSYELKWIVDVKISNKQIARIITAYRDMQTDFDLDTNVNLFDKNWVTGVAITGTAEVMVVGFIDGYFNVINTKSHNILHIV